MMPSNEYFRGIALSGEQNRQCKTNSGKFLRPHRGRIKTIIDRLGCESALDYGCGRGMQYEWKMPDGRTIEEYWGLRVVKYDPAHLRFATEPSGSYDLIICTHVLGLIPVVDLEWVVDRIYRMANKAIYVVLNTGATCKRNKARYRVEGIPSDWGAEEWLDLLGRRRTNGIEAHFIARPQDRSKTSGRFIIDDRGLREAI